MEITPMEIALYNLLVDEIGNRAEELVINQLGEARAAALLIAVYEDQAKDTDNWS
jgi:hypothetical protein